MRYVVFGGERMEEVKEYLGTVLSKHGGTEGETSEKYVKGSVIEALARVSNGRRVPLEVKRSLMNSILLPTLIYGL